MGKVLKGPATNEQSSGGTASGGLGGLLGGLLGGGGLGSILGAAAGAGVGSQVGGGGGSILGGGLGALIPTLLPAILGMLGGKGSTSPTGVHQLVDTMHANGLGEVAQSWIGTGPNQSVTPEQVKQMLTPAQVSELAAKSGLPEDQVNAGVAALLPAVVNHLTPGGTLPGAGQVQSVTAELQQALSGLTTR